MQANYEKSRFAGIFIFFNKSILNYLITKEPPFLIFKDEIIFLSSRNTKFF